MKNRLSLLLLTLVLFAVPVSAQRGFVFSLNELQTVPRSFSEASGRCVATLNGDDSELTVHCTHSVADATAAHIHLGVAGQAGPVVFSLGDAASPIDATWALSAEDLANLRAERFYVNVHSTANPPGDVRGQIVPVAEAGRERLRTALSGDEVVPPVVTEASGGCSAVLNGSDLTIDCAHDVQDAVAAHVHAGPRDGNGPVIFDLGDATSPIHAVWSLSVDELEMLRDGELYYQVHSAAYPPGELRGQLDGCLGGPNVLCLNQNRFRVEAEFIDPNGNGGAEMAPAVPLDLDSGTFWFFQPSNREMLVKVLDGCGVNNHYWVFSAATTNVEFTLTVTDTATGEVKSYSNPAATNAVPVLDTAAFATCP